MLGSHGSVAYNFYRDALSGSEAYTSWGSRRSAALAVCKAARALRAIGLGRRPEAREAWPAGGLIGRGPSAASALIFADCSSLS